ALVFHQDLDFPFGVTRDLLGREAVERGAEGLALTQDCDPREAGLKAVENELLVKRAVIPLRHTPFLVVIGNVKEIEARPRAAFGVGLAQPKGAGAGTGNLAKGGGGSRASPPGAGGGRPGASAPSARPSRTSASPDAPLTEPMVPIGVFPTSMFEPGEGRGPSPSTGTTRLLAVPLCSMRETTS